MLQRLVRQTWETFDKRAATWAREEGELGRIVDVEIRTLNTTWLEVAERLLDLSGKNIEGIVWHHPDGRMVKIKTRDFGMKRVMGNVRLTCGEDLNQTTRP